MKDYNTKRKKLVLPEYGRNIQRMVDYLKTITDKEKRNKVAWIIIGIMGNMNPHLRDIPDFKHKLWDHLALMSDFTLDIDSPYPDPNISEIFSKPSKVPYNQSSIKFKHYGKTIENLIEKAKEMQEGEEKDALIKLIANHMKKLYLLWNRESVSDELIFNDIFEISGGHIKLEAETYRLTESRDILNKSKHPKRPIPIRKPMGKPSGGYGKNRYHNPGYNQNYNSGNSNA